MRYFLASLFVLLMVVPVQARTCTSNGTGNWSAFATWSSATSRTTGGCYSTGGVPGDGDTAVVANGHTVTINQDIGTSGAGITKITVGTGSTSNTAVLAFDAAAPRTVTFDATGTLNIRRGAIANLVGTSTNRLTIKPVTGGYWKISDESWGNVDRLILHYCDLYNMGNATTRAIRFGPSSANSVFNLQYNRLYYVQNIYTAGVMTNYPKVTLDGAQVYPGVYAHNQSVNEGTGGGLNGFIEGSNWVNWTISGNFFGTGAVPVNTTVINEAVGGDTYGPNLIENNVMHVAATRAGIVLKSPATVRRNIAIRGIGTDLGNGFGGSASAGLANPTLWQANIVEGFKHNFEISSATTNNPTGLTIDGNFSLRAGDEDYYLTDTAGAVFKNNIATGATQWSLIIYWGSAVGRNAVDNLIYNNTFASVDGLNHQCSGFGRYSTDGAPTYTPNNWGAAYASSVYNNIYYRCNTGVMSINSFSTYALTNYNNFYSTTDPYNPDALAGVNDVVANPLFVDSTRGGGVAAYDLAHGGAGTNASFVDRMIDGTYTFEDVYLWIFNGFVPTNPALKGTGMNGADIGAAGVVVPNVPPTVSITTPASGTVLTTPATITVTADAADSDGTVARVDFYEGTTLLFSDTTSPYQYTWSDVPVGVYSLTAVAVDNSGAEITSDPRTLTVTDTVVRTNAALAGNGATVTASSQYGPAYAPPAVNDGDRMANDFSKSYLKGAWVDGTNHVFDDWVQVTFSSAKLIDEIDVYTLSQNYATRTTDPTLTETFTTLGITAFEVQYWTGSAWQTVTGGSVTGNNKVWRQFKFQAVTTDRVRVLVHGAVEEAYHQSRVVEIEAFTTAAINYYPTIAITAPTAGATATAPATISIEATAEDSDGTVARVDFYSGSTLIGTDSTAPYTYTYTPVPGGQLVLTARAYDDLGAETISSAVTVEVSNVVAPVVLTLSPASFTTGTTTTASIGGNYLYGGTTISVSGSGVTIGSPVVTDRGITASVTVTPGAALGTRTFTVTTSAGSATATSTITSTASPITYFIDPITGDDFNSGTDILSPKLTLRGLVKTVRPGDTVYLRGGTYGVGQGWYQQAGEGTAGTDAAPITLRNYPTEEPRFYGSGVYDVYVTIVYDWYIVDGLFFDRNPAYATSPQIHLNGAKHCVVRNNKFTGGASIKLLAADYNTIESNLGYNVGGDGGAPGYLGAGEFIYVAGGWYNLIQNNTAYSIGHAGISLGSLPDYSRFSAYNVVKNNTINQAVNAGLGYQGGGGGIYLNTQAHHNEVSDNIVSGVKGMPTIAQPKAGIYVSGNDNIINNNRVESYGLTGREDRGIFLASASSFNNLNAINNQITNNFVGPGYGMALYVREGEGYRTAGVNVANNTFLGNTLTTPIEALTSNNFVGAYTGSAKYPIYFGSYQDGAWPVFANGNRFINTTFKKPDGSAEDLNDNTVKIGYYYETGGWSTNIATAYTNYPAVFSTSAPTVGPNIWQRIFRSRIFH